jgi:hypothetical protein
MNIVFNVVSFFKYLKFFKHGKEFTDSPARTLSQSFNLNVVGGRAITLKQVSFTNILTQVKGDINLRWFC